MFDAIAHAWHWIWTGDSMDLRTKTDWARQLARLGIVLSAMYVVVGLGLLGEPKSEREELDNRVGKALIWLLLLPLRIALMPFRFLHFVGSAFMEGLRQGFAEHDSENIADR